MKTNKNVNYWCTWASQNYLSKIKGFEKGMTDEDFEGPAGALLARDEMNETTLFGEGGFADAFPEIRGELLLVIDDGWDVPYGAGKNGNAVFGSLEVDAERFPSYAGTPAERLKKLNERVRSIGWKGLGIWVSPQMCNEGVNISFDENPELHIEYWRERVLWSKHADVRYWKVDWGKGAKYPKYRKMMTDIGHELFPELVMEHASCIVPVNGVPEKGTILYRDNEEKFDHMKATVAFADSYRSYDVTDDMLSAVSTLDRLCEMLTRASGVVNCEDELYIGAALGCAVGIMRSEYGSRFMHSCRRLGEALAAIKWQSYAPPFSGGELKTSSDSLIDECFFSSHDTWYRAIMDTTVRQSAPRVIARNTGLPSVENDEKAPFVLASKNPAGAYSLAAVKRKMFYGDTQPPRVECSVGNTDRVGIFGRFESVTLNFDLPVKGVSAENLISGETVPLPAEKCVNGNTVKLTSDILSRFDCADDESESAAMFIFEF